MTSRQSFAETQLLALPDGRTLAFCEYGDEHGYPVFYAHGSPGSRLEGQIYHSNAKEYGIRLVVPDRPGFGHSSFQDRRRLIDYPSDVFQLSDHLGIERFGSVGHSGGGPYSIICRHALPERVEFAVSLGGYTNFGEMAGAASLLKTKADRVSVSLSRSHPKLFQLFFDMLALGIKFAPQSYCNALANASGEADKAIISAPEFREFLIDDQEEALRQGGKGAAQDAAILYQDWSIRLSKIPSRTLIFHGAEDRMVPIEFGRHLAAHIPGCLLNILDGQGHLFPWRQQDLIFQTVLAQAEC